MMLALHRRAAPIAACCVAMLLGLAGPATAQDENDIGKLRDALRRVTVDLRTAQSQATSLQSQLSQAQQTIATRDAEAKQLRAQIGQVQGKLDAATEKADGLQADLTTANATLETTRGDLDQTRRSLGHTQAQLHDTEARRVSTQAGLDQTSGFLKACQASNDQLYKVGREVLAAYDNKDLGDVLGQNEPFTQLKSVEMQNIIQDLQDKLTDARYRKPAK
jgi:chromosome segregation ATPase